MGLTSNHKILFGFTLILSIALHGLVLSYAPLQHWEIKNWGANAPERPLIHIKLSNIIKNIQQPQTNVTEPGKSKTPSKQFVTPKKQAPIMQQPARQPVTVAPKTKAIQTAKQSLAIPSTAKSDTDSIQPKEPHMTVAISKAADFQPINEAISDPEVDTRPPRNRPPQTPNYLNNPKPCYPLAAKRRGMQGRVILEVIVSRTGTATKITIKKSSGYRLLDQAASETVASWQFVPATENGEDVEAIVEVPIRFELTQG